MHLLIDPRAGSNKLIERFEGECEPCVLESGDITFMGNGPDGDWVIGIEHKQIEDLVNCIKTGRFTGTQLPAMLRQYDLSFMIIEGIARVDRNSGQLMRYQGKYAHSMYLSFKAFNNFLTSVAVHSSLSGKPCIVKFSSGPFETDHIIRDTYDLFQKRWEEHISISRPDLTKMANLPYALEIIDVKPEDPEYPKYYLRKAVFQVDGMGWEKAKEISERYLTMEAAMQAGEKDFQAVKGVGEILAKRIYQTLHGYADPTVKRKKKLPLPIPLIA